MAWTRLGWCLSAGLVLAACADDTEEPAAQCDRVAFRVADDEICPPPVGEGEHTTGSVDGGFEEHTSGETVCEHGECGDESGFPLPDGDTGDIPMDDAGAATETGDPAAETGHVEGTGEGFAEVCGDGLDNDLNDLPDCYDFVCEELPECAGYPDPVGEQPPESSDPSLDITQAWVFATPEGEPWVRVAFDGAWPPSPEIYSWFVRVSLGDSGQSVEVTTEHHDGEDQVFAFPRELSEDLTIVTTGDGFRLLLPLDLDPEFFVVQAGMQLTPTADFIQDATDFHTIEALATLPFPE